MAFTPASLCSFSTIQMLLGFLILFWNPFLAFIFGIVCYTHMALEWIVPELESERETGLFESGFAPSFLLSWLFRVLWMLTAMDTSAAWAVGYFSAPESRLLLKHLGFDD